MGPKEMGGKPGESARVRIVQRKANTSDYGATYCNYYSPRAGSSLSREMRRIAQVVQPPPVY
jgi:hypothetical protein